MKGYDHDRHEPKIQKPVCASLPPAHMQLGKLMHTYLTGRGLNHGLALRNGWYPSYGAGDLFPRVVMPATSNQPGNKYWQARDMSGDSRIRYQSPRASRGDAVIVVRPLANENGRALVVEGPMDALAGAEVGYLSIALMGAKPPLEALALTRKLIGGRLTTCLGDHDLAEAFLPVMLYLLEQDAAVYFATPYPYKDLAEAPLDMRDIILRKEDR